MAKIKYELGRCPFCKGEARLYPVSLNIVCQGCGARISRATSIDELVSMWNRRSDGGIPTIQEVSLDDVRAFHDGDRECGSTENAAAELQKCQPNMPPNVAEAKCCEECKPSGHEDCGENGVSVYQSVIDYVFPPVGATKMEDGKPFAGMVNMFVDALNGWRNIALDYQNHLRQCDGERMRLREKVGVLDARMARISEIAHKTRFDRDLQRNGMRFFVEIDGEKIAIDYKYILDAANAPKRIYNVARGYAEDDGRP